MLSAFHRKAYKAHGSDATQQDDDEGVRDDDAAAVAAVAAGRCCLCCVKVLTRTIPLLSSSLLSMLVWLASNGDNMCKLEVTSDHTIMSTL